MASTTVKPTHPTIDHDSAGYTSTNDNIEILSPPPVLSSELKSICLATPEVVRMVVVIFIHVHVHILNVPLLLIQTRKFVIMLE